MYNNIFHKKDIQNISFLITGGAGFIGSNLVEYFLKYNAGKVVVLDNLSTGYMENINEFLDRPNFKFIKGDIRDFSTCLDACEGIDVVFHQAALGSVPRSIKDPCTTNEVNISGTLNMMKAGVDRKVKRFVYAASSSVYGDSPVLPKKEENIGKPLSPYAVTKYVNEVYADVFFKVYGLPCVGLRYFNVFGPRQSPEGAYAAVIPLFIKHTLEGTSPTINGNGEQTRDFTFVENAVQANIRAAFCDDKCLNEVFNVAVGDRTSLNELVVAISEIAGRQVKVVHGPDRAGDIRDSLADIRKASDLMGYNPEIRIKEGLGITFRWFTEYFKKHEN